MPNILRRFLEAAGCETQAELAEFLGVTQVTVSTAKKKGSIPPGWLLLLLREKGINPDWVLTGQGARLLQPAGNADNAPPSPAAVEIRPPEACSLEELVIEVVRRAAKRGKPSGRR